MEMTIESMAEIVRRIVARELEAIDAKGSLSEDDVDKLAKLALVMQRIGVRATGSGSPAGDMTGEQLMKRAQLDG